MSSTVHPFLRDFHLSPRPVLAPLLSRAAATLRAWRKRSREKWVLARLDERDWHDMGLSRSDVDAELRRPFWRAPPPC